MRDDLLSLYLHFPLECGVNNTGSPLFRASKISVQGVDQPTKELDRIASLRDLELACAPFRDLLQELVRTNLRFEQLRVPQSPTKRCESRDELRRSSRVLQLGSGRVEEEGANRWYV